MKMTSWKYWSFYFVFSWAAAWTWNVISSWSTWGFKCCQYHGELTDSSGSYCMHCKVCMHLNHGICTSSTDYLLAYDRLHSHSMCHFHAQPVAYCKIYMQDNVTQLRQSSMLKLALFPAAFCWYCQWSKEGCHSTCVYTPYSITSKATT